MSMVLLTMMVLMLWIKYLLLKAKVDQYQFHGDGYHHPITFVVYGLTLRFP
jgi:hypothetical protein